jgi:hypothetical protein
VGGVINGIQKILLIIHLFLFKYVQKEILMNSVFSSNNNKIEEIKKIPSLPM